jgi:hypothetical protein
MPAFSTAKPASTGTAASTVGIVASIYQRQPALVNHWNRHAITTRSQEAVLMYTAHETPTTRVDAC